MGLEIQNRLFFSEQYPAGNTFLLSNVSKLNTETFEVISNFDFTSTINEQIMFDSEDTIKLLGGTWSGKGILIGDVLDLSGIAVNASGLSIDFSSQPPNTVQNISGDTLTFTNPLYTPISASFDFSGVIMPIQNQSTSLTIVNTTRDTPEVIEFFHNTVLNTSQFVQSSLLDGEVNRFRAENVNTLSVGASASFTQLGDRSGGRYVGSPTIERLPDSGGDRVFKISLQYFLLSYEDADLLEPDWYLAQQCLKPVFRLFGYPQLNNPNSEIVVDSPNLEANTGFFNENYNQGINDFTLDSVTIQDSNGVAISAIDPNQTNTVTVTYNAASNFNDFVEVLFEVVPPSSDFENNALSNLNNSYVSYFSKDGASAANTQVYQKNNGEVLTDNHVVSVGVNQITVSFDLVPNVEFADYINSLPQSSRLYRLSLVLESAGGTTNNNNSVSLIISEGELTKAPIPDAPFDGVASSDFFNHAQDLTTGFGEPSYIGRTEDDFVYKAVLNMPENEEYEQLTIDVEVVRDSDGTSFDLYSTAFLFANVPTISGVQQFNETQNVNQLLDGAGRNVISFINTGNTGSGTYETELIVSLLANWREWLPNNNAFLDFYDITLPQNGRPQEWVRYLELSGFSIRLRCRLIQDNVAYFFGGGIILDDYDQNFDGTTTITYYDDTNTQVSSLITGQINRIQADHVLNSGSWDVNDTWGWIAQRGFESDPRKQISTVWDWSSQNLPLQPLTGESTATLEIITTNSLNDTARVQCSIDLTGGAIEDNTIVARIQSPISPECENPINYLIDLAAANADDEAEIPTIINNYLFNGIKPTNICCPDCTVRIISTGQDVELYAFGSKSDIDNLVNDIDSDVNPICCRDEYAVSEGCETGFDAIWNDLMLQLTGNTAMLTAMIPSQLNTYTNTDLQALSNKVQSITTDGTIRYAIMDVILRNGIKVICDNGDQNISGI